MSDNSTLFCGNMNGDTFNYWIKPSLKMVNLFISS